MSSTKAIIEADFDLPICSTCGAQFDADTPASHICEICADERQYVPQGGQVWTSLRKLTDNGRHIEFAVDIEDKDMYWLNTTPAFAIGQSPLLVQTPSGWVMVECCGFVTVEAVEMIKSMVSKSKLPLLGIAISHPHWYNSSTTWARALGCKVFASELDREWWTRKESLDEIVDWWVGPTLKLGDHVTMILSGGHFPGSCCTHIKRDDSRASLLCTADTIMLGSSSVRRQVSWMYSYPNFIPLEPEAILQIWRAISPYPYENAYGAWPNRRIVGGARREIYDQLGPFLKHQGFEVVQLGLEKFEEV